MTLQELKAHAYDCLANIEVLQRELQATNQKIAELSKDNKDNSPKNDLRAR